MLIIRLLNMSISAGFIILAITLLRLILRKAPRKYICILWALAAFRLVCPFSLESALSLIPSRETIPEEIFYYEETSLHTPVRIDIVDNPVFQQSVSVQTAYSVDSAQTKAVFFTLIWIFGMGLMILYALIGYLRLRIRVSASISMSGNIRILDEIPSPFIFGLLKPVIYLPSGIDKKALDYVITHEQAHIERHDHWWKPLGFILLAVYWFDPLCWLAYILFCKDIEIACDEKVIQEMSKEDKAAYSQALLDLSFPRRTVIACPLAFGEIGVKERVKSVLNYKKPTFWIITAAAISCVLIAVCFLTDPKTGILPNRLNIVFAVYSNGESEFDLPLDAAEALEDIINKYSSSFFPADSYEPDHLSTYISLNYPNGSCYTVHYQYYSGFSLLHGKEDDYRTIVTKYNSAGKAQKAWKMDFDFDEAFVNWEKQYNIAAWTGKHALPGSYICAQAGFSSSRFALTLYSDGTFQYYEGFLSSYIGMGSWKYDGSTVILSDNALGNEYYFTLDGTSLVFDKNRSAKFLHSDIADGTKFIRAEDFNHASATKWFDCLNGDEMIWDGIREINLDEYPGVTFRWQAEKLEAVTDEGIVPLYTGMPIWSVYFFDFDLDGKRELCSSISIGSGMVDNRVIIYDYASGESYDFLNRSERMDCGYTLNMHDGKLYIEQKDFTQDKILAQGELLFQSGTFQIIWDTYGKSETGGADAPSIAYSTAAAYANYSDALEIYLKAMNNDTFAQSATLHLPVFRLDSTDDLKAFKEAFGNYLTLDHGYDEMPSFNDIASTYTDGFFEKNTVILAYVPSSSGSFRYGVTDIYCDRDLFCMYIGKINDPETYTSDMSGWFVIVETDKSYVRGCTSFDAQLH